MCFGTGACAAEAVVAWLHGCVAAILDPPSGSAILDASILVSPSCIAVILEPNGIRTRNADKSLNDASWQGACADEGIVKMASPIEDITASEKTCSGRYSKITAAKLGVIE